MREVRFSLCPAGGTVTNSWAGWPAAATAAPYLILRATVTGRVDPQTGYLCNIQLIDQLLRAHGVSAITRRNSPTAACGEALILETWNAVMPSVPQDLVLEALCLHVTPYLRFSIRAGDAHMVMLTQSFEFSAAHRLYCVELSEQQNQEVFGKCSNPNGHGHNYQLEVSLVGEPDPQTGRVIDLTRFETIVRQRVIDRFDHKHLNLDCPEFGNLNPSVENITSVIWQLLDGAFEPAHLGTVRVWETPKTYAEMSSKP